MYQKKEVKTYRVRHKKKYPQKANSNSWKPGQSGCPKGRPKGTKNRFTKDQKDILRKLLFQFATVETMGEAWEKLEPYHKLLIIEKWQKMVMKDGRHKDKIQNNDIKILVNYTDTFKNQIEDTDYEED